MPTDLDLMVQAIFVLWDPIVYYIKVHCLVLITARSVRFNCIL